LAGEQAVQSAGGDCLIFRTAWLYRTRRKSFVSKTLEWACKNEVLKLVDNQISNLTWASVLA